MRKLIYGDCFPRLLQNIRQYPGRWAARLVFLLGPWLSFWMVEILNGNDVFNDLYAWQVLMNLIWYYLLFFLCRLILGRNQWACTAGALLSFAFGPGGTRRPMWLAVSITPWIWRWNRP